jgi:hypothetical protein
MFNKSLKKLLVGVAALATVGAAAFASTSASAAPWHGGWYGRGYGPGVVIGAGLVGAAIGASLERPYYGPPPAAHVGPGYWGYYDGCRAYWHWSPHLGRYVRDVRCY